MAKKVQLKKVAVKSVKKAAPTKKAAPAKKTAPAKVTPKAVKGKVIKGKAAVPKKEVKKKEVVSKVKKAVPVKKVTPKAVKAGVKGGVPVKEIKKKEVVTAAKKGAPAKKVTPAKGIAKPVPAKAAKAEVKGGVSVKEVKKKEVVSAAKKEPQKATVLGKEIRAVLLARRQNLLKEILENRARESDSLKREIGDIYDEASTERDRELSLLLGDRDRQKLKDIDEALQRIEGGEYGICESCGENIATGRLKAQPFTKLCINCKAEEERQEARRKKFEAEGVYRNLIYGEEEEG
ncbi:MAG: TraR/DksA family transcriptional regulator [Deltaproteobacteria bacterium]|nr:TraR/DksA family transcriptional regulator [Deltaproteobacteria bacterium]